MCKLRPIHTFERNGRYFAVDVYDTFCFECDRITHDVLQYYPEHTQNEILHTLGEKYPENELQEVWNELEYLRSVGYIIKHKKLEAWVQSLTQGSNLNTLSFLIDEEKKSEIRKTISLTCLKSLPYTQTNQKFNINLWIHKNPNSLRNISIFLKELFEEKVIVHSKDIQIKFIIRFPDFTYQQGKIEPDENVFLIFPEINSDFLKQLEGGEEKEIPNLLNSSNGCILYIPEKISFPNTVEKLHNQGFKKIYLDIFAPLALNPELGIQAFYKELNNLSVAYTQQLKKRNRFVLEPIMQLFLNILNGTPIKRQDPAGVKEWFITPDGDIYGGYLYFRKKICKIGNIFHEETSLKEAEKIYCLGINSVPVCIRCWAQNFCGGGSGAIHYQFTGRINEPLSDWCTAHRQWIENLIACYQELSHAGVVLTQDIIPDTKIPKPSRLTILKHIFRSFFHEFITIRPIQPQDEEWLTHWETWNDNIYFTLNSGNILTTTHHEKEQEILNPNKDYEEWVIIDKKSNPRGLIKVQPHSIPNLTTVYIYFHSPNDYLNKDIQENFQTLLNQIKNRFPKTRWIIPVNPEDTNLTTFVQKLNFQKSGTLREVLFLHNQYRSIDIYIA